MLGAIGPHFDGIEAELAALNELLEPSGTQLARNEYALLSGPVLARIFFERAEPTDAFIQATVTQWLARG